MPKKVKDVRSFIGLTSYYRKYIKNFAKIANPLINLTKNENKFKWSDIENNALEFLKNAIITAPVLAKFRGRIPSFRHYKCINRGTFGHSRTRKP
jgi:hypothetical protein